MRIVTILSWVVLAGVQPVVAATSGIPANSDSGQPFNLGFSTLFSFGGASVNDAELAHLQGGGHDPNRNGFSLQQAELVVGGSVDPYFDARANVVMLIDAAGETVVEVEEAYLTTRALPGGLQAKGGQYYTEFGRQNTQHPHQWAFVDQPVVLTRFFGPDGLRSGGARVSWLVPTPWFSELYVGAQNAGGETLTSFLSVPGASVGGYTLGDRGGARSFGDLLFSARWLHGFDLGETTSANIGVSYLDGPNASGADTDTRIAGIDTYIKWKARQNVRGFPFVAWQTEVLTRDYATPDVTLEDSGGYTQWLWGYKPGWVAGMRAEYAAGTPVDTADPLRDRRWRVSPNLTWYPSEFSRLRVQYNRDFAQHLSGETADAVWLQYEFALGAHAAHQF